MHVTDYEIVKNHIVFIEHQDRKYRVEFREEDPIWGIDLEWSSVYDCNDDRDLKLVDPADAMLYRQLVLLAFAYCGKMAISSSAKDK